MEFIRDVENNSVSLRMRKAFRDADISSHTILTDDVFSYVDFFFKTHKKVLKTKDGKRVEQNHSFYWQQARNFYNAAKNLPVESSPLPMYYCMLNAVKAYLFYYAKTFEEIKAAFKSHGLKEGTDENGSCSIDLDHILVCRKKEGVFCSFAKKENPDFDSLWPNRDTVFFSLKRLISHLPFVHSAYVSTYKLPRKSEKFIPIIANQSPKYMFAEGEKGNRIHLVFDLDRHYFKQNAAKLPNEIISAIPEQFAVNDTNPFQLYSKDRFKKGDIKKTYNSFRPCFSYISGDKRIWYLKKEEKDDCLSKINTMVLEIAIVHRFSEIVRYKPEQMIEMLNGKENWLIHEFLSLVLDQFMDEIACEITKQEIMPTRIK